MSFLKEYFLPVALIMGSLAEPRMAAAQNMRQQVEQALVSANQVRAQKGLPALQTNPQLNALVKQWLDRYAGALKANRGELPAGQEELCVFLERSGLPAKTCGDGFSNTGAAGLLNSWQDPSYLLNSQMQNMGMAESQGVTGGVLMSEVLNETLDRNVFLQAINSIRKNPVQYQPQLDKAAQFWADQHARLGLVAAHHHEGSDVEKRVEAQGYVWANVSENVGRVVTMDARNVFQGWWNSPGHRKNMLDENMKEIGLGCAIAPLPGQPNLGSKVCVLVLANPL